MNQRLTTQDVATTLGVDVRAVLGWIASGELRATNVARNRSSSRPRWRIRPEDVEAFELARSTADQEKRPAKRRVPPAVKEWF